MMVAAWTLVRLSLTRRARAEHVEMTMGRFVLRSIPPGLQEPSAADVPAGSASRLAHRGEAGAKAIAVS
ncbi:MAG: hypothetical protein EON55_11125 [Alphaproteobacteria bacterium]|jgi:hypothetical protein|nr:MAG: hypothetical protein EON55_11125 [Alphaproteobacteria bacterium]